MNDEIILKINYFTQYVDPPYIDAFEACHSVKIQTTRQTIELNISKEQFCCEVWGIYLKDHVNDCSYAESLLHLKDFEGKRIEKIEGLSDIKYCDEDKYDAQEYWTTFVIRVSEGPPINLVAFTNHNSYYCHSVTASFIDETGQKRDQELSV